MLNQRLFLLQECCNGLVAVCDQRTRTVNRRLQYGVERSNHLWIEHQDNTDGEGSEQGIHVDPLAPRQVSPDPVHDIAEGAEAGQPLPYPYEGTTIAQHGLEDGV